MRLSAPIFEDFSKGDALALGNLFRRARVPSGTMKLVFAVLHFAIPAAPQISLSFCDAEPDAERSACLDYFPESYTAIRCFI
ncbi:MAG: hypothetical protein ACI4QA_07525 [Candidatus Spyradosoma sp.]